MWLLIFNLWYENKIREYKTLIHTFTNRIEDKTNDNNNNKQKTKIKTKNIK